MKKFFYIANIRIPTERAHGIQIAEMCQAFAQEGAEVTLVVPNRRTPIEENPFKFYDIKENFKIQRLWCVDTVGWGKVGFWFEYLTFILSVVFKYLFIDEVFYTREAVLAVVLKILGKKVYWEGHMGQDNFFTNFLIKSGVKFVVITEALKDLYVSSGIKRDNILVSPDGADIDRFDLDISKTKAREDMDIPQDKKIVLYKGSLIPWKGAGTLAESSRYIKSDSVQIIFIGGTAEDVENFKKDYDQDEALSIRGNRPRKETPIYQKAADILVIPNSAKEDISKLYTSPMKLFGYMAGGVPIVASDLPSIREVLDESYAYFFTPDDPKSLANTIDTVFSNYDEAEAKAKRALEKVRNYSWKRRAKSILAFIGA